MLWIDAGNGAAGDMLLAALLDAGADREAVLGGLAGLPMEPVDVSIQEVRRHGLRALHVDMGLPPGDHAHRGLADVLAVLSGADLPAPVATFAVDVFGRLARAEASVHGIDVDEVRFHEVGAHDAIADVVGCALALDSLRLLGGEVVVSPVAVGRGAVRTAHGTLPVPPPAVLRLLVDGGVPVAEHDGAGELCTPTGAALLVALATGFGGLPACTPVRVGVGAGTRDPAGHANILRVVVGDRPAAAAAPPVTTDLVVVEATVDDLDPRVWPDVLAAMRRAGAADAWCTPVLMHKGRPGHVLTVLTAPSYLDAVSHEVFRQTSTLGLRLHDVRRQALPRDRMVVRYGGMDVGVKRGLLDGEVVTAEPEYDDARRAAEATGLPLRRVLAEVRRAAGDRPVDVAEAVPADGLAAVRAPTIETERH